MWHCQIQVFDVVPMRLLHEQATLSCHLSQKLSITEDTIKNKHHSNG